MKINKITLRNLRNDTHFQFHTEFKDLAQKHNPAAMKIASQYDAYLPLYDKVDLALKKINKSAITEKIQNADKARDDSNLIRERFDESSLKVDIVLKKARLHLDEAYYAIVERVNALVVVEGVADYEAFIRKLNISIAKYNLLATQASKKPEAWRGKEINNRRFS